MAVKNFGAAFLEGGRPDLRLSADADGEPVQGLVDCALTKADKPAANFDGWDDVPGDEISQAALGHADIACGLFEAQKFAGLGVGLFAHAITDAVKFAVFPWEVRTLNSHTLQQRNGATTAGAQSCSTAPRAGR